MARPIITLTTDFGLRDPYVAEMKAIILSICPEAMIVDISHEIEKFNIRQAAFVLACAAPYFPKGTIHVAVVDPGVGTKRKPILIQARNATYIGPDNGILARARHELAGIIGSHGPLEISTNQESAAKRLKTGIGDESELFLAHQ